MTWEATSALAPAGPQAARLAHAIWIFISVGAVVYVVVLAAVVIAIARRRETPFDEHRRLRVVAVAGGVTTLVLVALLIVSVRAGHGLNPMRGAHDVVTVQVVGRQWWWEFKYPGGSPDQQVSTANELHIPVGRPVLLELVSRDVIHSFWVPALHGKRDLVPGHDSSMYIQADHAAVFRGQCAEFCGAEHAKMGFLVIAEPPSDFEAWLMRQRRAPSSSVASMDAEARRGQELFQTGTCPMCHAVSGTRVAATLGPDLSHVAGRLTLGAGSTGNVREHLARWVFDSQEIKPGNLMPPTPLPAADLSALVSYLETLR